MSRRSSSPICACSLRIFSTAARRSSTAGGPRSRGGAEEGVSHALRTWRPGDTAPKRRVRLGDPEMASRFADPRRARESRFRGPLRLACRTSGDMVSESSLNSCPKSLAAGDCAPWNWRVRPGDVAYSIPVVPKLPVAARVIRAAKGGCVRLCVTRFSDIAPGIPPARACAGSICPRPKAAVVTAALPCLILDRTCRFVDWLSIDANIILRGEGCLFLTVTLSCQGYVKLVDRANKWLQRKQQNTHSCSWRAGHSRK